MDTDDYVNTLVDFANDRASANKCEGYAFQFGYVIADIQSMLVELGLNKKQMKLLEKRKARSFKDPA